MCGAEFSFVGVTFHVFTIFFFSRSFIVIDRPDHIWKYQLQLKPNMRMAIDCFYNELEGKLRMHMETLVTTLAAFDSLKIPSNDIYI